MVEILNKSSTTSKPPGRYTLIGNKCRDYAIGPVRGRGEKYRTEAG